jgi:hypothetical protein
VSELLSMIDTYLCTDVHGLAELALLVQTEMLIEVRDRLDAALSGHLQALDVREVTVNECGRQTRAWLVEAQRLSPRDAGQRVWVARHLPLFPAVAAAFTAGEINFELDLGRSTPTWSRAQRRARRIEDKGCTWPGCPLARCQIHHPKHWWAHRGPTDLVNGTHLCAFHHWLIHHRNWEIRRNPEGKIEVRPT